MSSLVVDVKDLVGHPEASRSFSGAVPMKLRLGDATVEGPMEVVGVVTGTVDGVLARFTATATGDLTCVRCLTEWKAEITAGGSQHFGKIPDEDGYAIAENRVDLTGPAKDELALALPAAPLCKRDCLGLCPTCGTDLNREPCGGHGEESDSPFAVLRDLLDS
ncbi:MAG TPA: DUF177 domain-containing protein [Acidimicrobiia bacterium]|nr:DUF177 domain-containing protein [Acidimicrobiia bacterium]